jgi:hypothetical protein
VIRGVEIAAAEVIVFCFFKFLAPVVFVWSFRRRHCFVATVVVTFTHVFLIKRPNLFQNIYNQKTHIEVDT